MVDSRDLFGVDPAVATPAQKQEATNTLGSRLYKDSIRKKIGLDKNYLQQWWSWTSNAARGDLVDLDALVAALDAAREMFRL